MVIGWVFRNGTAIARLVGAIPREQNDEWAVQRMKTIAPWSDAPIAGLPAMAA